MCGGGGYRPPPQPVVKQVVKQAAVTPAAGVKKKSTRQVPAIGSSAKMNLLGGTGGIGDDALNLGGKTIMGGG